MAFWMQSRQMVLKSLICTVAATKVSISARSKALMEFDFHSESSVRTLVKMEEEQCAPAVSVTSCGATWKHRSDKSDCGRIAVALQTSCPVIVNTAVNARICWSVLTASFCCLPHPTGYADVSGTYGLMSAINLQPAPDAIEEICWASTHTSSAGDFCEMPSEFGEGSCGQCAEHPQANELSELRHNELHELQPEAESEGDLGYRLCVYHPGWSPFQDSARSRHLRFCDYAHR